MKLAARLTKALVPLAAAAALVATLAPAVAARAPRVVVADEADFPAGYTGYHTYAETQADMESVAATYGAGGANIVQLLDIGKSFEGRSIWAIKISDNVGADEGEPEILTECNMHAREHLTAEQCIYMVHLLTDNYGQAGALGERVTNIVNSRVIWIIPMLNPDGAMFDISGGYFHKWRKNRQTFSYSNKVGIDLNRNWSYQWGCCRGSGPNPKSAKYRGQFPFEATENQVLRDFILSRRADGIQRITEVLNVHSYGNHVLYPYGYTKEDVPADMSADDHAAFVALAAQMANLNGYRAMQGSAMYIYDGDFIDWAYGDQGIFAFTFEMYPRWGCRCGGFKPPDSIIERETSRNTDAILFLLEQADCPWRPAGLAAAHCA
jgi:murein tripeptide amidase MpaA